MNIATYEAQFEAASLAKAATAGVRFDAALPRATALRAAVLRKPLSIRGTDGSKLIKPFIKDWTTAERTRNTGTIRQGFFKGQTNFQIIQKSRGTAVLKYADAFWLRHTVARQRWFGRRAARAGQARMEIAKANANVVQQIEWLRRWTAISARFAAA